MIASKAGEPTPRVDVDGVEDTQDALALELFGRHVDSQNVGDLNVCALDRIHTLSDKLYTAEKARDNAAARSRRMEARAAEAERKAAKCSGKCAGLHAEINAILAALDAANGMRDHAIKRVEAAELDARRLREQLAIALSVHPDLNVTIDAVLRRSAP